MVRLFPKRDARQRRDQSSVDAIRDVLGGSSEVVLDAVIVEPAGYYRRRLMTTHAGSEGFIEWILNEMLGTALTSRQVKSDDRAAKVIAVQTAPRTLMVLFESEIGFCQCEVSDNTYGAPKRFPLSAITGVGLKGRLFFVTLKFEIEGNSLKLSSGKRRELRALGMNLKQCLEN